MLHASSSPPPHALTASSPLQSRQPKLMFFNKLYLLVTLVFPVILVNLVNLVVTVNVIFDILDAILFPMMYNMWGLT